jgi:hypothetical protein
MFWVLIQLWKTLDILSDILNSKSIFHCCNACNYAWHQQFSVSTEQICDCVDLNSSLLKEHFYSKNSQFQVSSADENIMICIMSD